MLWFKKSNSSSSSNNNSSSDLKLWCVASTRISFDPYIAINVRCVNRWDLLDRPTTTHESRTRKNNDDLRDSPQIISTLQHKMIAINTSFDYTSSSDRTSSFVFIHY
jgi:hypothetical protein